MRPAQKIASASIVLLAVTGPGLATASPTFPAAIQADLSLTYDLGTTHCIICHSSNVGGIGTVVTPFGTNMRAAGLVLENLTSLHIALDTLEADKTDSDCNGVPDIQQLEDGQDPSTGAYIDGSGRPNPVEPGCMTGPAGATFGCGAQLARATAPWQGAALVIAALGAVRVRRRRSRLSVR